MRWLAKDVVAGLVLSALLVPQGMAYAELAGLPAVTGLYTSILCLVGYAVFGPSKFAVAADPAVLMFGADSVGGDSYAWLHSTLAVSTAVTLAEQVLMLVLKRSSGSDWDAWSTTA